MVAFAYGARPATLAAVLSGLCAWYFFIPPVWSFEIDLEVAVALAFYVLIVGMDILLIDALQKTARLVNDERLKTASLLDQQTLLFQELQHRVANNMQFAASLLRMQSKTVRNDPASAVEALSAARHRLEQFSRVHRRLYDPQAFEIPVGDHLRRMCADLSEATDSGHVTIDVDAPNIRLDMSRLTTLSMLTLELVSNSLKHAFEGIENPRIDITIAHADSAASYELLVVDNGRGLPDGFDPGASSRLGFRIIQGFGKQLGGTVVFENEGGARARLVFPAVTR
jgi:two-component sensor histidine kinase